MKGDRKRQGEGFSGFQSGRNDRNYRSSSDYRSDLTRRTGGSRSGYGHGHGYGNHHQYHHHGHHNRHFYLHFGFPYFGFGFGNNSFYARVVLGYPYYSWPYYYSHYYYPYWGYGYYPYYSSYCYYPIYRTVYVYDGGRRGYAGDGYWEGRGHDDPYVEPEAPPGEENFDDAPVEGDGADAEESAAAPIERVDPADAETGAAALSTPLTDDVDTWKSHDAAEAAGDRFLKDGWGMKAAESYRQAWQHDPRDETMLKLAIALLDGGDYPLASWALVRGVGSDEKRVLDYTVGLDDLLGGPRITRSTDSLEKYLVDNPNDEGSNFLLGALYVVTGREYAGYMVLTRLRAADFETETVDLFIKQARLALGK